MQKLSTPRRLQLLHLPLVSPPPILYHTNTIRITNSMLSCMVCKSVPRACPNQPVLSLISPALSPLDSSIQSQSIKDCFRLGKFSSGASRPRPILIKFVRVADVASILAKRKNLSHPFSIKPDMSPDQRLQESVLMRERWSLIQSGTSRNHIRIRGNSMYVRGKLHGWVLDFKLVHEIQDHGSSLPNSPSLRSNSPTVKRDQQSSHHVQITQAFDESNVPSVDDACSQHGPPTSVSDNPSPISPTLSNVPSLQS